MVLDEGYYDEGEGRNDLNHWYRTDAGNPDVGGVGTIDYYERFRRAAAPLRGPQTKADAF